MRKTLIALGLAGALATFVALDVNLVYGAESPYSLEPPHTIETPKPHFLKAHVQVDIRNGVYTYKIINAEEKHSVAFFQLSIKNIPVTVVGSPVGWQSKTYDGRSVFWSTEDEANMIPPGKSLGGFQIYSPTVNSVSTPYILVGFEDPTITSEKAVVTFGSVASPSN
jgi:hypothetical protein